jgi:secreted trypsin-like serine protease
MRSVVAILAFALVCEARPSIDIGPSPSFDFEPMIVGGVEATPGEFPWQLSQQRQSGTTWSHSCGASLLTNRYALSASHCVQGAAVNILRVIAGLHERSNLANGQISNVVSYKLHEQYNTGGGTFGNDIAILTLETNILENPDMPGRVEYAPLVPDDSTDFAGQICTLSGWGRTSASNVLPENLMKVDIPVISVAECNERMGACNCGTDVQATHICVYNTAANQGSCNGDSGGPMNCQFGGRTVVAGITSWGISSGGACRQDYPSVYTRVSKYLDWITTNTP